MQDGKVTAPDDKLVVTTSKTVAVGEKIIVKGLAKTNVDIAADYNSKILLEEESFNK